MVPQKSSPNLNIRVTRNHQVSFIIQPTSKAVQGAVKKNAKPAARRGRKATGPTGTAGLPFPKNGESARFFIAGPSSDRGVTVV